VAELLAGCATCSAQWDETAREPYVIYREGDYYNQIYYENQASLSEKIKLAERYQLGGVALWALGYEDKELLSPLSAYKQSFRFLPWQ
jgi:spore germination protein YaaH